MIKIKSEKGITLVTLVITIVILLIISGTAIYNMNSSNGAAKHNNLIADLRLLNDKVLVYYNKYGEIPITNKSIKIPDKNNEQYYELDLSKLEEVTLNYGIEYGKVDNLELTSDIYVINSKLNIYYLKGVARGNTIYHEIANGEPEPEPGPNPGPNPGQTNKLIDLYKNGNIILGAK